MRNADQVVVFNSNRALQEQKQERVLTVAPLLAGSSDAATQLRAQVRRIAPYFHVASLAGAPGSGEEQVARALHECCPHRDRTFHLLTAADAERRFAINRLQPVGEGFLYLADTEHLSTTAQAGLLRLMRERAHRPLRLVAYTGKGLKPLLSAGLFNPELANLLGALSITLPPLTERKADLGLLFQTLLDEAARGHITRPPFLSEEFLQALTEQEWPGNLYQMRRAATWLMDSRTGTLQAADLAAALEATGRSKPRDESQHQTRMIPLDHVVQEHIRSVLMACNGNKLRAAEVLGISRSTLYRMLDSVSSYNPFQMAG